MYHLVQTNNHYKQNQITNGICQTTTAVPRSKQQKQWKSVAQDQNSGKLINVWLLIHVLNKQTINMEQLHDYLLSF